MIPISHPIDAAAPADATTKPDSWFDRVTADSADSFPASDPPSWSPLRVGSPAHDPRRRLQYG
jgi:hypothetical protein